MLAHGLRASKSITIPNPVSRAESIPIVAQDFLTDVSITTEALMAHLDNYILDLQEQRAVRRNRECVHGARRLP